MSVSLSVSACGALDPLPRAVWYVVAAYALSLRLLFLKALTLCCNVVASHSFITLEASVRRFETSRLFCIQLLVQKRTLRSLLDGTHVTWLHCFTTFERIRWFLWCAIAATAFCQEIRYEQEISRADLWWVFHVPHAAVSFQTRSAKRGYTVLTKRWSNLYVYKHLSGNSHHTLYESQLPLLTTHYGCSRPVPPTSNPSSTP